MNARYTQLIAGRVEPCSTLSFEFPDLPQTLASMVTGEDCPARMTATLPRNYSPEGKFPLLVFLLPYGRGEVHGPTRSFIGWDDFICVHLPTFKRAYDKSEPCRGILVTLDDLQTVSSAFSTMLRELFAIVPNVDPERSAMGGFSNGGLTTALLLAGQDDFVLRHFRSFVFVEGADLLAANVLHKPAMKCKRLLVLRGDDFNGAAVREACFLLDRALALLAREYQLDLTLISMSGVKHDFPDQYAIQVGQWIRGEQMQRPVLDAPCSN